MSLDVDALRSHFPSLSSGIAHFDGPGGTQTAREVAEAIAATLCGPLSNRGTAVESERNADRAVSEYRQAAADLLGADPRGVVHGRSATQLTYDLSRAIAKTWRAGDEIVLSSLDHDANVAPWLQAAERADVTVRWWELDPGTAELDVDGLAGLVGDRTRLVAVAGASNLLGTIPPVAEAAALARSVGALTYVDAVHLAAHTSVDLAALGADLLVCSPYKFFGPHCGILVARPDLLESLQPDKLRPSTDAVPERFELGTMPYELLAGVTATIDFLASWSGDERAPRPDRLRDAFARFGEHEERLRARIEDQVGAWDRVTCRSRAARRTPTLYLTFDGIEAAEVSRRLAAADVQAPSGSFYAHEPYRRLGLDAPGLRVGVAAYTTDDDVDRLLTGVADAVGA